MDAFSRATGHWFAQNFSGPTAVQSRGWEVIRSGAHALLLAPTGSGKTLAAFLWSIDQLLTGPVPDKPGVRTLYVSPLKALVYDVERNLRAPLYGIQQAAQSLAQPARDLTVAIRTGDTPPRERQRQLREPSEILVTTPESLFLLLGSSAADALRTVETVIVDEVHALAPTKRGAHLALSLERLSALCAREPQRIGLSATAKPAHEVARFLAGARTVEIVDATARPRLDLIVTVPVPDMERPPAAPAAAPSGSILAGLHPREAATPPAERGMWPAIYPELLALIRANRSTLIFVNSRGLCERLCQRLNELAGEELVRAHHGSVSAEQRTQIEEGLKSGKVPALVATSSLELGIDMGAIDLVVMVESPGSVARGLQRVGRAGHSVGQVSVGRIFPKFRGDLLECAVVAQRMRCGEIESLSVPRNPLDVLAQQVSAMSAAGVHNVDELAAIVRRAYPFAGLSEAAFHAVLEMLSGSYPSTEFADLRPLLSWDRHANTLQPRRGTAWTVRVNAGTIPDRGNYIVQLGVEGPRLGELDEEMVFETRKGEVILLGASAWRVEDITRDRVIVSPAPGEPGKLPFWHGDSPGRPLELGTAIGAFTRQVANLEREEALAHLTEDVQLDRFAAQNLFNYLAEQQQHTGTLPTDRSITVERFRDELGDWRVCILTPFGARIHAPWAMALQRRLSARSGADVQVMYTDDGIVLRLADVEELPATELLFPEPDEAEELLTEQLGDTALCASLFRENAARALLLTRRGSGQRSPLWAQRLKSQQLLAAVKRFPSFPVLLETYRQMLSDVFDLAGFKGLLRRVQQRDIQVVDVETPSASPFARSLVFAYVAAYIYEQDAPLAERKAQALTLDRRLLAELLGQAELRDLLDAEVLAQIETEVQALTDERAARDPDELHDVLRRLGDLTEEELAQRCAQMPGPWLTQLVQERRAILLGMAQQRRWVAAQDAGLYRDALGCVTPPGLPVSYLASVEEPLERLLLRYARSRGPFTTRAAAGRYGLLPAQVEPTLRRLEARGTLVHGELRPGGVEPEWCETEMLRRIKRQTLAKLRQEVAPLEASVLGRFLPKWQGVGGERRGYDWLMDVIGQLEGLPLAWSSLSTVILPQRVAEFSVDQLDQLAASGRIVWVGCGPLGAHDGRIALYRRERVADWLRPPESVPSDPLHNAMLAHLTQRGASFTFDLEAVARRTVPTLRGEDFTAALWDLVWAGLITNDTFAPLRNLGRRKVRAGAGRHGSAAALAGGRWSRVADLLDDTRAGTERGVHRAQVLLDRYGVVTRAVGQAESLEGGFAPLYRVLKAMEETGRVRRGYFIEGLPGAQFAYGAALERLRTLRNDMDAPGVLSQVVMLAANDPANSYGALLPWPENTGIEARPRRAPGNWVVLVDGRLALWLSAGARQVLTFLGSYTDHAAQYRAAFAAVHAAPRAWRRGVWVIEAIDGVAARSSALAPCMTDLGFEADHRGFVIPHTAADNTVVPLRRLSGR